MFIELHIIQNFAPSNLNRDDTNAPKDCMFGGFRRARISSQCEKRAIRRHEAFTKEVTGSNGDLGIRTKRLANEISKRLVKLGRLEEKAMSVAKCIIDCAGIGFKGDKTKYLLYIGKEEIEGLAGVANDNWDELNSLCEKQGKDESDSEKKRKKKLKGAIKEAIKGVFGKKPGLAADIALFGRMVADNKNMNINAACQVAHAISTNEVKMQMDFYTAVDDLLPDDESGSDMMGMIEFNSSCFYRYSTVNMDILLENLGGDHEMAGTAVLGFIKASVLAIPTGKQNSMAAQNPPHYVRVIVRNQGAPWSLANAFISPVRPGKKEDEDIASKSIIKLEEHLENIKKMYGSGGFKADAVSSINGPGISLDDLTEKIGDALDNSGGDEK